MKTPKIQIIGIKKEYIIEKFGDDITCSSYDSPKSLDEFNITIIDLNYPSIWENYSFDKDFEKISSNVFHSKKTKVIFILTQNDKIRTTGSSTNDIKHKIDVFKDRFLRLFNIEIPGFLFEQTSTKINNKKIESDFCFVQENIPILTQSVDSEKITTTERNDIILTTLNLSSYDDLMDFLKEINLIQNKTDVPEWFSEIEMFDDKELNEVIEKNVNKIDFLKNQNEGFNDKLEVNNKYKSILYTNGDELVEVVYEILEDILEYDLSDFEDKGDDDFLIKKDTVTFVGEIKGIGKNVKSNNLSQTDRHYTKYMDKLQEENKSENVRSLLIINPLRQKPLNKRKPVEQEQIDLAINKYDCLIVTTENLLKLYEKFKNNEINTETIINKFDDSGLFEI